MARPLSGTFKPWTTGEIEKLRKLYPVLPSAEVAAQLGRTQQAVVEKAHVLGLKADGGSWATYTGPQVARFLGVGTSMISRWTMAGWLGCIRRQPRLIIDGQQLWSFIQKYPHLARLDRMPESEWRDLALKVAQRSAA